jgi:SAM-dependent methyltransferase
MSDIVIACGGMPFGPDTLKTKSLGGSETAALMAGKALAARGHNVVMFCVLDGYAGGKHEDGVTYAHLQFFADYNSITPNDILIAVRDPRLVAMPSQARKKVLWMHDIATKRGMQRAFEQMMWTHDEVWTVSEWHRKQVHETTGYPLSHIFAMRNGIVPVHVEQDLILRDPKQLIYAARPERGLDNLIKPGGIMEHLPDYTLKVAMYAHFPEDQRAYYEQIFARMAQMPNVEYVGSKTQVQLRTMIRESAAYVYPTQFEETSCILARECIEQQTPMLTTRAGALPETLGYCGVFFEDWAGFHHTEQPPEKGSAVWCQLYARFIRAVLDDQYLMDGVAKYMADRTDLYWDGVAEAMEARFQPVEGTLFSRVWSLILDGDVIPAQALAKQDLANGTPLTPAKASLYTELFAQYRFLEEDMQAYYETTYTMRDGKEEERLQFVTTFRTPRLEAIEAEIAKLAPGSRVLEYGCGCGHVLAPLAIKFPLINFAGYDYSPSAVDVINKGALDNTIPNLLAYHSLDGRGSDFDAVICSEVLEHTIRPWETLAEAEKLAKPGGAMILTVPFGAWEPLMYMKKGHWHYREHVWQIDRRMFEEMWGSRPVHYNGLVMGASPEGRPIGNLVVTYQTDHRPLKAVDPLAKAMRHKPRQTCAAAIIAYNNEDTILKLLNSIEWNVQFVKIALGPSTDKTREYVAAWFAERPWVRYQIVDVPKIEPWKFGFDDARNESCKDLGLDHEWFLWIDTDEYLSGDFRKYLTNSAIQGYLLAQHHFTCVPRGAPPEIDRPARLLRTTAGYKANGHIHEHFEVPEGGPGRCFMPADVDIGHPGYVNETVRRERFQRNYPFLEWDHATAGKDRKLHHFLWFRDLIHRMRFSTNPGEQHTLAVEAEKYYNEHTEDMAAFGPGLFMSLQYLAEVNRVLGKGMEINMQIKLEDRGANLGGRFTDFEQLSKALKTLLEPEFKDRNSRYY